MRRRLGIRRLILIMGLLPVLLLSTGLSAYLMYSQIHELRNMMTERAKTSSQHIAIIAEHMIAAEHSDTLNQIATAALEESTVRSVTIYNAKMAIISHAGPKLKLPNNPFNTPDINPQLHFSTNGLLVVQAITELSAQQSSHQEALGWVVMQFNWHHLETRQYQSLLVGIVFLVSAFLICVSLTSYINQSISYDLNTLRQAVRRMTSGHKNFHAHIPGNDEFSEIADELNQLNSAHQSELQDLQQSVELSNTDLRETLETVEIQNIELDLARREAVNASRIKSEFLANTSHEIRTPLSGIIGFSNILLKSELQQRQREAIETINNSANNLLTIINDILDFSKLEAGKLVLDSAPVNLREIIEDTMQILVPGTHDKQLELALLIQAGTPEIVQSDALRLKQILANLINNAIKFTSAGQIYINVLCNEKDEEQASITIQITDTGIGLSKDQQKKIFKDFSQADASITRQYGGTGLGLVIVKGLVEQMGGEIGIDSEPGHGATFWFTVKFKIVHNAIKIRDFNALRGKSLSLYDNSELHTQSLNLLFESWGITSSQHTDIQTLKFDTDYTVICTGTDDNISPETLNQLPRPAVILSPHSHHYDDDHSDHIFLSKPVSHIKLFDALHKGLRHPAKIPLRQFTGCHILAVDDNPSNLHILSSFMQDMGVSIETAQNGSEALQYCREKYFDLIFMDIQMPHMDGIETSREIRKNGHNKYTPIIALSAYLSPENPMQLREAGINDFLSKPVSEHQLCELLANHIPLPEADDTDSLPRPVDIAQCLHLTKGRPNLAADMLGMLLDSLKTQKQAIVDARTQANLSELNNLNHKLKGACCYTGTPTLKASISALEDALESGEKYHKEVDLVLAAIDELIFWQEEHDLEVVFDF
jgi:two-component system sensor histidine kinase BarA